MKLHSKYTEQKLEKNPEKSIAGTAEKNPDNITVEHNRLEYKLRRRDPTKQGISYYSVEKTPK